MSDEENRRVGDLGRFVPAPDPTTRTIEVLEREVKSIHDKLDTTAVTLSNELHTSIDHRAELTAQAFASVEQRFQLIEAARIEQKLDTKTAVDAALIAQKNAVTEQTIASDRSIAKSESATSKSLEQQYSTFTAALAGLDGKNTDLKDRIGVVDSDLKSRMTILESVKKGEKDNTAALLAGLASLVGVIALILSAMALFAK